MGRREKYIFATEYNRKPHHIFRKFLLIVLTILLVGFLANVIFNYNLRYERVPVTVANLPSDLENFSILHLSDLHGREGLGASIKKALGSRSYSCVVRTGDMLGKNGETAGLLEVIRALPADIPKLLIPGDEDPDYLTPYAHSSLSVYADWAEEIIRAGVTILDEPYLMTRGRNDAARIWFIPEELYTVSLESIEHTYQGVLERLPASLTADQVAQKRVAEYQIARVGRIRETIRSMQATDIQVAVSHEPLSEAISQTVVSWSSRSDVFALRQASLILCGHYCGGQWRLPGVGAIYVPGLGWFPDDSLITGKGYIGRIPQYISPGLGTSGAYPYQPFRLFNNPTISSIELTQKFVE